MVNLQFYSVLLHFIRALILNGYQPNDKERLLNCGVMFRLLPVILIL